MYVKIIHFFIQLAGWTTIDYNRQMGISWEFRGKNLELLVLGMKELGKLLGTSWE